MVPEESRRGLPPSISGEIGGRLTGLKRKAVCLLPRFVLHPREPQIHIVALGVQAVDVRAVAAKYDVFFAAGSLERECANALLGIADNEKSAVDADGDFSAALTCGRHDRR